MTITYKELVNELKTKLKIKNISFKKIFNLINKEEYDEITIKIDDENILDLIVKIIVKREDIAKYFEQKLNDLNWLNEELVKFNRPQQLSVNKARQLLRTIFINIYDLADKQYDKETTKELFKEDLKENPDRRYPLKVAKQYNTFKLFLKKI